MTLETVDIKQLLIEYSDDATLAWNAAGHTWNDVSDVVGTLDPSGGDKPSETMQTFGDTIVSVGKSSAINIALNVVFKNSTTTFLKFLQDTWDGTDGEEFYIRWSYNEGAEGARRFTSKVILTTNPFTGSDASAAGPVTKNLTLVTDKINPDVVPSA